MRRINEPEAIARIKRKLSLDEVAKLENITVDTDVVEERAIQLQRDLEDDSIDIDRVREVVKDELTTENTLEWLIANSAIKFVPEGTLKPQEEPEAQSDDESTEADAKDEATAS
jgi:trigger factor